MKTLRLRFAPAILAGVLAFHACAEEPKPAPAKDELPTIEKLDDLFAAMKATKKKLVLLNIWSSGCTGCLAEMPALAAAAAKSMKDGEDLAYMGLSTDGMIFGKEGAQERAAGIVKDKGLPYPNVIWAGEDTPLTEKLGMEAQPFNAIFSGDGKRLLIFEVPTDIEKAQAVIAEKVKAARAELAKAEAPAPAPDAEKK
ncbi:MAG: hypothetical protein KIS92_05115 [Planctomycetota bacterium]|nr:hypothetical protein [Planctomycetota bacterium]